MLPKANPDFDTAYERVLYWWLEIDDSNQVQREIGFDQSGQAAAIAPWRDNMGIFTDHADAPDHTGPAVDPAEFEATWQAASATLGT